MAKTVLKYTLNPEEGGIQKISMYKGASILDAQMQAGKLVIWASVDTNREQENRKFICIFTGEYLPEQYMYNHVSTVQDGEIVYHIFLVIGW